MSALSRVKVWIAETLFASDLNAEFNNILNYINNSLATITYVNGLITTGAFSGLLTGLTLSTAGSSGTFGVAAGYAADSTAAAVLTLGSAFTKTTGAWAVGSGNGGLDTGSIANATWYHAYLIQRSDTGAVDVLFSLSASAPTMPANYDRKRRIGSMKTDGSAQWIKFSQLGDQFLWAVAVEDAVGVTPPDASAHLITLSVPSGVQVESLFDTRSTYNSSVDYTIVSSPDQTDTAPDSTHWTHFNQASSQEVFRPYSIRTNTSAQIRWRAATNGGGSPALIYYVFTRGWVDNRARN